MSGSSDAQQVVYDYYADEANGRHPKIAMGGLKLVSFKTARDALVKQGKLVKTPQGRYRPAEPETTATNATTMTVQHDHPTTAPCGPKCPVAQPDPPAAA